MKMRYEKPVVAVDRYDLTQAIAACNIKIGSLDSMCVRKDSDANSAMKVFAINNGFTSQGGCAVPVAWGQEFESSSYDSLCYHTSSNAAFNS